MTNANKVRALLTCLGVSVAAQGVGQDKLVVRAGGRHHAGRVTLTGPEAERNHAAEVLVGSAEPRSGP